SRSRPCGKNFLCAKNSISFLSLGRNGFNLLTTTSRCRSDFLSVPTFEGAFLALRETRSHLDNFLLWSLFKFANKLVDFSFAVGDSPITFLISACVIRLKINDCVSCYHNRFPVASEAPLKRRSDYEN